MKPRTQNLKEKIKNLKEFHEFKKDAKKQLNDVKEK